MEKIKDNIYVETEYLGCNPGFVVTSNGVVMIDTPGLRPRDAFEWKKKMEVFGNVAYLINTDHHWDHTFGNYFFGGDIIMHEGTMKKLLDQDINGVFKNFVELIDSKSGLFREHYSIRKPRFTYTNKMDIYLGDEIFELVHFSGHTEHETIVFLPLKKVLFAGDNVCTIGIPSVRESYPTEWLEALAFMDELDIDVLVPGHGKIGDKGSIKTFQVELCSLIDRVKEKIDKGFSKDEIVNEVHYEDNVHRQYPPETQGRFRQNVKIGIGRLYDVLMSK